MATKATERFNVSAPSLTARGLPAHPSHQSEYLTDLLTIWFVRYGCLEGNE